MYVHAYQSYVWNCVVSRRVREFGLDPRPGDLALCGTVSDDDDHDGMIANWVELGDILHSKVSSSKALKGN